VRHIVIIGMGEVGRHLAVTLSREGHSVRAVDRNAESLSLATEHADLQTLEGQGASLSVLRDVQAGNADLVIAVTDSDEVNMLAAITAKQLGAREVIARVADGAYYEEEGGIAHDVVGIDLLINPQVLAAMEIHRVIRSFGAIEAKNLADNRVEVVDIPVTETTRYLGKQLRDLSWPQGALIAGILRADRLLIPNGGSHIELGDHLWIIGDIDAIPRMQKMFGHSSVRRGRRVMIAGGGEIGLELARRLERDGVHCTIIDSDIERCKHLAISLKDTLVIHGDGTNRSLLVDEEIASCDSFVALTHGDEVNIMAALLARSLDVPRTIALVHRVDFQQAAAAVGLDVAISPRRSTAEYILSHVRSEQVSRVVEVENGRAEILELHVPERARVVGRSLMYIDFPEGCIIGCIVRGTRVFIPSGTDEILPGDTVVMFTVPEVSQDVLRMFRDPKHH
jgi:trk system potassium uptake protein TrkA